MSFADLSLEAAFAVGASTSTWLHLDDPTRGLLDTATLGGIGGEDVWADLTPYLRSFNTRRGSSRVDGPAVRYEAGTLTAVLRNDDRRFDPAYLDGPYVEAGVTQVKPMVAVRLRATFGSTAYDVWRGFADSWSVAYDQSGTRYAECTLTATDAFKYLSNYDRVALEPAVGAGEDSGARVDRILDSVSWSDTDRMVATGDSLLQATTMDGTALTELLLVADTELGEVYVDGAGRVVFRNRLALVEDVRSNTVQATFGDSG